MLLLNIVINCFGEPDYYFMAFIPGLAFVIYITVSFFRQKKMKASSSQNTEQNSLTVETDVLGMPKLAANQESYTTINNVINWRLFLLVALATLGLYLIIYTNQKTKPIDVGPTGYDRIENVKD